MIVPFSEMPKDSRVWIYQSNRKFLDTELNEVNDSISKFLKTWTAHGSELLSSYQIKYNRFIIISLNESVKSASGCSIDSCIHFIQDLEKRYKIDLLDKMNVTFKQGKYITYKSINDFKKLVKNKSVSRKTIVFNNLVIDISDYLANWEVSAEKSWHLRFFNK
jgi:hypothetical protein|tara:strand:- start:1343 stop:1831 length:489 start_codon:yes stop_codon:yes gene_type:complete